MVIGEIKETQLDLYGQDTWKQKSMIDLHEKYSVDQLLKQIRIKDTSRPKQLTLKHFTKQKYTRNWKIYEQACQREKLMFFKIIKDATHHLKIKWNYKGNGRPQADYSDIIKSLCIRLYSNYSSWRTESELTIAKSMGIIDTIHKRSTLNKYLQSTQVTKILQELYKVIAEPLTDVETHFAVDATGISNKYSNKRWSQIRHTRHEEGERRKYTKLHILCGVKTNVICSTIITKGTESDSPHLPQLLDDAKKSFNITELSADAGYLSKKNVKAIHQAGAKPYIQGKKNINIQKTGPNTPWGEMLYTWYYNQPLFAAHYHKRSNVESTFGMLKRKFGDGCRSKLLTSQTNEILCKIVCHNASVLSKALLEYDLSKGFIANI